MHARARARMQMYMCEYYAHPHTHALHTRVPPCGHAWSSPNTVA